MKKALIDPRTNRIAQVQSSDQIFPVALPLFWTDCTDDILSDEYTYSEGIFTKIIRAENKNVLSEAQKLHNLLIQKGVLSAEDKLE